MKKQLKLKALLFTTLFSVCILNVKSQDFGDVLGAGLDDANNYLEAFIEPGMNSFGNGLAGGWYNTAKPHKLFGVDFTLSVNLATIPDAEKTFSFASRNFTNLQYTGGSEPLPTVVGGPAPEDASGNPYELFIPVGTTVSYGGQSIDLEDEIAFPVAPGADLEDLPVVGTPVPTFNLGIGLIKNTDLKIRLIPSQDLGDFSISMFGIGVMHDIKQWIPGMKLLPFELSGFFGTTSLSADFEMDDVSNTETGSSGGTTTSTTFTGSNMSSSFSASATTIQVLASKKLAILTPYVGVGLNFVKSSIDVKGDFTYRTDVTAAPAPTVTQSIDFSDPINLEFTGAGGPRLTVGARLKLLILTIHADYTLQKYNQLTAGIGLAIR